MFFGGAMGLVLCWWFIKLEYGARVVHPLNITIMDVIS
jgi:hypothetical protein